jgi:uncharacterized membrane protein YfcA
MIFFIICFFASVIGSICGIGGGIIIKPALDSLGIMSISSISFLSGCSVLAMTSYSLIKSKFDNNININYKIGLPLALGASVGGILGKNLFQFVLGFYYDKNKIGAIQAICILIITLGTLVYTINKSRIKTYKMENTFFCFIIGLILGILSSFLGIGGGPINLVVLFYFFTMKTKIAVINSLNIIFFSQITSIFRSVIFNDIPKFSMNILFFMVIGGILGGITGCLINKKIKDSTVDKLFIFLMIFMIFINTYNIFKYI